MNIMIPVGSASTPTNQNNVFLDFGELKYALRSVDQYLTNVDNVYLVFGTPSIPSWINRETTRIHYRMDLFRSEYKSRNIYNKILDHFKISESFLFMNDDHFLLQEFDANQFPNYVSTLTLKQQADAIGGETEYKKTLANTIELLGEDSLNYDTHCPIIYNRDLFLQAFSGVIMSKPWGYGIKSIYGNRNLRNPIAAADTKIRMVMTDTQIANLLNGQPFFSTDDNVFGNSMRLILEEIYPNKSKYEL